MKKNTLLLILTTLSFFGCEKYELETYPTLDGTYLVSFVRHDGVNTYEFPLVVVLFIWDMRFFMVVITGPNNIILTYLRGWMDIGMTYESITLWVEYYILETL